MNEIADDSTEFKKLLLKEVSTELSEEQMDLVVRFRREVLVENSVQNLTRLLSPLDFLEGHLRDVLHLRKSGFLRFPAMDLGAGMGVPGLLYALLFPSDQEQWISSDSEGMKAAFMQRMVDLFSLKNVTIHSGRAEIYLSSHKVGSIIARAVGPVGRIFGWIRKCSTWNTLILLKGPGWNEEWTNFKNLPEKTRLKFVDEYHYEVGAELKQRVIVTLSKI